MRYDRLTVYPSIPAKKFIVHFGNDEAIIIMNMFKGVKKEYDRQSAQ